MTAYAFRKLLIPDKLKYLVWLLLRPPARILTFIISVYFTIKKVNLLDLQIKPARALRGTVAVPGDKSISHRAVMLGALAEGETVIENYLPGEDCLSTIDCFRKLGAGITGPEAGVVRVRGCGLHGLAEPREILDAGNSGTTMRLMLGILAGQPFFSVITGDSSLRRRPMARVTRPLGLMGARIDGRQNGNLAPLSVRGGGLKPVDYVSPVASAQVKSAVLLAGLYAAGETTVTEPHRSRDHTERMLGLFGAEVDVAETTVRVKGSPRLAGRRITVPGDISSAAFLIVAAAGIPGSDLTLTGVGINPTRNGIIEVLLEMGAGIELVNPREEGGEPVADIRVRYAGKLSGVAVGPLLKDLAQYDSLEGRANVSLDVSARGASVAALKKALNGKAAVRITDGALKGINIAQSIRNAKAALGTLRGQRVERSDQSQRTDFTELTATFDIRDGVARNHDLSMKSPLLRVAGEGEIRLAEDTLNYLVKAAIVATSRGQGGRERAELAGVTVPVRVAGPIGSPFYTLDFSAMVTEAAKQKLEQAVTRRLEERLLGGAAKPGAQEGAQQAPQEGARRDPVRDVLRGLFGR
ncbi:MAG: AsmA family protein [Peptococcaceae bacterium]|nr:AsmA family protein [Peptococcaceae bacterium]